MLLGSFQNVIVEHGFMTMRQESGIPMPHHIAVNRDGLEPGQDPPGFVETEDYVELNGERLPDPPSTDTETTLTLGAKRAHMKQDSETGGV